MALMKLRRQGGNEKGTTGPTSEGCVHGGGASRDPRDSNPRPPLRPELSKDAPFLPLVEWMARPLTRLLREALLSRYHLLHLPPRLMPLALPEPPPRRDSANRTSQAVWPLKYFEGTKSGDGMEFGDDHRW